MFCLRNSLTCIRARHSLAGVHPRMSRVSRRLATDHARGSPIRPKSVKDTSHAEIPHIAVIGAGFAGLRCADVLLHLGARVTIFEARDRVGGRVHQANIDDQIVDMGPNWIHGTENNPIMEIATATGGIVVEPDEQQMIFDASGRIKPKKESIELGAEVWATIIDAFKYSNEHYETIDPQRSLMDFFRAEVPKRFPKDSLKVSEVLKEASMWGHFVGGAIEKQSLRCFFLEDTLSGENVYLATTYKQVLTEVESKPLKSAEVKLNEAVVGIRYRRNDDDFSKVSVTTKQGSTSTFDEVVVTCPLGWLKRNKNAFLPSLTPRLQQAIDNLGYGNLEKLYVRFPSAFWLDASRDDPTEIVTTTSDIGLKTSKASPTFAHFQSPQYHPDLASKSSTTWNVAMVSLAHMPGPTSHPTLLFYLYGDCALHLTSLIASLEPHSVEYNDKLLSFATPFFSRLPNYASSAANCIPTSFLLTSWETDPYAGYGSYSNFQVGLVEGGIDIETIRNADGLGDQGRGLWFAGEHTAPFIAVGTTTGAYWSGEAVAQRIGKAYNLDEPVRSGDNTPGKTLQQGDL